MLIVADEVLIGGEEIPRRLPGIIEEGLAGDGVDLPNYPALITFLREQDALDPRYPDRLIVRQAPGPEADVPDPPADSVPVEDSIPGEAPVASGAPPDTVRAGVGEGQPEAGSRPAEVPVADPPVAENSVPGDSVAGHSAAQAPGIEAPAVDSSSDDPPTGRDVPDSASSGSPGEAPPGSVGSMDLTQAARDLESMSMWDRFNLDPAGSSLSVLVLLGMIISLVLRGFPPRVRGGEWPGWAIPVLVLVGVAVASYLSFIEITHAQAACGPVGDCNTVNQSKYAYLFGVLPVGVFGLVGYGFILALWLLRRIGPEGARKVAGLGLWGGALFGTLFSVYLTFLEPFVIGATCAWCLSSAVIMTLLLWASAPLAARAWPGEI
jgi:uncharacterized membrane protein